MRKVIQHILALFRPAPAPVRKHKTEFGVIGADRGMPILHDGKEVAKFYVFDKELIKELRSHIKMTVVVHCKKQPFDIYIGRPSKWGNPYSHKKGTAAQFLVGSREEAIEAYRKWITEGDGMHLLDDLHELKGKVIACWCHPLPCHGDVLAELAEQANDPSM